MPDLPHILIIMPDQLRADALGCAGHPMVKTPNIDRIAGEGMRFTNAVTPSPVCMPARASFISGRYPHQHHMWWNAGSLPADDETFFHHLQASGYHTAHIGKSHYYPHIGHLRDYEPYMRARGFDYVHEVTGPHATVNADSYMTDHWRELGILDAFRDDYRKRDKLSVWPSPHPWEEFQDSYVGGHAVDYVADLAPDMPTCTFVGFGGPHEPWDAPEPYASMYDPADTPSAIPPEEGGDWLSDHARHWLHKGRIEGMTAEHIAAIRANYYGKISIVDHWVGRILDAYEQRGWLDNTLIIFWSDHGDMTGDHGRLHKIVHYRGSVDVPFIVRWPGFVPEGETSDALVQAVDIFPTLTELARRKVSDRIAGKSLWPILRGKEESVRETAFSEVTRNRGQDRTVLVRTARCAYSVDQTGQGYGLYDLERDPEERVNLVGHPDYEDVECDMRDRLIRFLLSEQDVQQRSPKA